MRVSSSAWADRGPPFQRVVGDAAVCKKGHERGAVRCLRYGDGSEAALVHGEEFRHGGTPPHPCNYTSHPSFIP